MCRLGQLSTHSWTPPGEKEGQRQQRERCGSIKEQVEGVSDLRGRTLELQEHQGAGALQDVEVEEKRLLPVRG